MKPAIKDLLDDYGILPNYVWPGGYQIVYYDKQNNLLCPTCANADLVSVEAWDIYYEGPDMQCDECYCTIESAYGDPEDKS